MGHTYKYITSKLFGGSGPERPSATKMVITITNISQEDSLIGCTMKRRSSCRAAQVDQCTRERRTDLICLREQ